MTSHPESSAQPYVGTLENLARRYRRFVTLRCLTDDILTKIRYLNQIAVSMREGWMDEDGASQELELTERQLHDCIDRLRGLAGQED